MTLAGCYYKVCCSRIYVLSVIDGILVHPLHFPLAENRNYFTRVDPLFALYA